MARKARTKAFKNRSTCRSSDTAMAKCRSVIGNTQPNFIYQWIGH